MYRTSAGPATLVCPLPPSPTTTTDIDRRKDIGLHFVPQFTQPYLQAPLREGLRTPPADDMSTTYQNAHYNNYGGRQDGTYTKSGSSSIGYAGAYPSGAITQTKSNPTLGQPSAASASVLRYGLESFLAPEPPPSPSPSKPQCLEISDDVSRRGSASSDMISSNLQVPTSININGGSLAEFAAQITCLFWFESTETLKYAEQLSTSPCPVRRLRDEAIPSSSFRKWVVTILSTTQVTQNVILLALLFIYRLKTTNPAVKGRSGSEYRLLTVALMLGNKFLDDNTYTNKTWAEVSGISVNEIHIMEVEFLSNMRYSLLATKEQWQEWQEKLRNFSIYCDRATKAPVLPVPQQVLNRQTTLPSPPNSMQSSPPSLANMQPSHSASVPYTQSWSTASYATPIISPIVNMPDLNFRRTRKRSFDDTLDEPAAKRISRPTAPSTATYTSGIPPLRQDAPRLPVPNLTISTTQPFNKPTGSTSFAQSMPLLPLPNGRAMSTVYPSTPSWATQLPVITPAGPQNQSGPEVSGYVTPTRRQSPHSVHELLTLGSSPVSGIFPDQSQGHISPSFYLQQRASPYKPVRHFNALLCPPPSTSMHDYSVATGQMHYQPLGKRHDMRSGVVPDYAYHPSYQQWRGLPQPNFHS